jgi:hypothetical protein
MWRADATVIQAACQLQFSAKNEWWIKDWIGKLVESATDSWEFSPRNRERQWRAIPA